MTHDDVIDELRSVLPGDALVVDPARMSGYRYDRAHLSDAGTPLAIVKPATTAEVQTVVRIAAAHRTPIIVRGAGTSLAGGSTARDGAITLSTERMRAIAVDPSTRTAVVQPGLLNAEVKAAAKEHGLWYPPDPSSYEICSIGGNIATNAGGLCCVKYGVTTDYVLGLEVVLADGTAVRLGGPRIKDVAGLPLTRLFVGSEGALGIVTEATLRLVALPEAATVAVAFFPSVQAATNAVIAVSSRLRPSIVEFMDRVSINAVEDMTKMGLDRDAEALLLVGCDARGDAVADELELIAQVFVEHGSTEHFVADDAESAEAFLTARRLALPAMEALGAVLIEDVGVPLPRLGDLIEGIGAIGRRHGILVGTVAHAGDGNTHPNVIYDAMDPAQVERAQVVFGEIMDLAI
ncbi:MAG TPA: FAD-linked oxidase C-terminal domain-containing protein, partial [Microbacteriaceae bacterium]|nr:FAD-linked oxidase C-terminal domain-containing protein [Microbacteriaceae bacterium]